jgi:hypothetical protein
VTRTIGSYVVDEMLPAGPTPDSVSARRLAPDGSAVGPRVVLTPARRLDLDETGLLRHALALPTHPNLARIRDVARASESDWPWFVLDYLPCEPLPWLIRRERDFALPLVEALRILDEICAGVGALHDEDILHRNLSMRTIVRTHPLGTVKIAGLEFARVPGQQREQAGQLLAVSGMPSPEACMGLPVDQRGDIFQIGTIAYELVCGVPPFPGGLETGILYKLINGLHDPVSAHRPQMDPALADLVERALQHDRSARWSSVGDVRAALARIRGRVETRVHADGTLFDAAWIGDEAGIARLLAGGASPHDEMSGLSPLHLACASGSVGAAQALLRAGARVDAAATVGEALQPPAWWYLIARPPRRRAYVGEFLDGPIHCTPFHLACDAGHADVVSLLLAHGADPYMEIYLDAGGENFVEWTPTDLARGEIGETSHNAVLRVLSEYIASHPRSEASRAARDAKFANVKAYSHGCRTKS